MAEEEILEILKQKSRDKSRTPVQWDDSENAGFTNGTPWIKAANNYREINAQQALTRRKFCFLSLSKVDWASETI